MISQRYEDQVVTKTKGIQGDYRMGNWEVVILLKPHLKQWK